MQKIKSVTISFQDAQTNEIFKQAYREYDENEHQLVSISYTHDGEIGEKIERKYNDKGQKVLETFFLAETDTNEKTEIKYNQNNQIEEELQYFMDGSILKKQYIRNDDDNFLLIKFFDDNEETDEKEEIKYDASGNILERKIWDDFGALTEHHIIEYENGNPVKDTEPGFVTQYKYDENNDLIKQVKRNHKGDLVEAFTYQYDEKGRITEQSIVNHYLMKYIYDDENNTRTEQHINSAGVVEQEKITYYDDNIIREEKIPGGKIKYEYEFFDE